MPKEFCGPCSAYQYCHLENIIEEEGAEARSIIDSNPNYIRCPSYTIFKNNNFLLVPGQIIEEIILPLEPVVEPVPVSLPVPPPEPTPPEIPPQPPKIRITHLEANVFTPKVKPPEKRPKKKELPHSPIHEFINVDQYLKKVRLPEELHPIFHEIIVARAKLPKIMEEQERKQQYGPELQKIFKLHGYYQDGQYDQDVVIPLYLLSQQLIRMWQEDKQELE